MSATPKQEQCARCGRFVGEEALQGWEGGIFGDYSERYYCAFGVGCNASPEDPVLELDVGGDTA